MSIIEQKVALQSIKITIKICFSLTEKYRTPIVDKRMNSIKKPSTQKEATEEKNGVVAKNKKRTAKAADISIVYVLYIFGHP